MVEVDLQNANCDRNLRGKCVAHGKMYGNLQIWQRDCVNPPLLCIWENLTPEFEPVLTHMMIFVNLYHATRIEAQFAILTAVT